MGGFFRRGYGTQLLVARNGKPRRLPWVDVADRAAVICLFAGAVILLRGLRWFVPAPSAWLYQAKIECVAGSVILCVGIVLAIFVKRATK